MYLAIGFVIEHEGFVASRKVNDTNPQKVADQLHKEFGLYLDQILLVKNDEDCPTVVHHWSIDKDYSEAD